MTRLILASASPRRRELLAAIGLAAEVIPSNFPEESVSMAGLTPRDYVIRRAREKAHQVARDCGGDAVTIGADTTVSLNGEFLNKPSDPADACAMLRRLSGQTHQVYTGVCVCQTADGRVVRHEEDCACTDVTFDPINDDTIERYVRTGEPLDKAGAYGIQGRALTFIPRITGDYFNVVGLPLHLLIKMLAPFGVSIW